MRRKENGDTAAMGHEARSMMDVYDIACCRQAPVLDFPQQEDQNVLFIAYPSGSTHMEKAEQAREASLVVEHLMSKALFCEASVELVEHVARNL